MDSIELSSVIKDKSKKLGFDLVGITSPHIIDDNSLEYWLDNGKFDAFPPLKLD